jgi:hypothetical protein
MISLQELKKKISEHEIHKVNDALEGCYNQGLRTAVAVIEIYETSERLFSSLKEKR